MVNPHKIKFNKISSEELGIIDLILCVAFDSDNGESNSFLNREAVTSESHDGRYKRIARYKYSESFSPKFTFMKKGFGNFTIEEVRQVLKWLTSLDTTALLDVYYDDSEVVAWSAIGGWTEINTYKFANNRTVGITATFEAVTPYAMSDLYTITQNVATQINTTMYYWTSTTVSGVTVPQYLLTSTQTLEVGTRVYSVPSAITGTVITVPTTLYGTISAINEDNVYTINDTTFTLTSQGTKIKRTYNNKIIIDIDTDDNKPVFPRITINHGYSTTSTPVPHSIIPVSPEKTYNYNSTDMVENTVYFNGATYYWKPSTAQYRVDNTRPTTDYNKSWPEKSVSVEPKMNTMENETLYLYNSKYYWIDPPYTFRSSPSDPNLGTTSVKFTNKHTDFFGSQTTHNATIVKNNTPTENVVLDGANKIISTNSTSRIFGDDFNWQWLELYDGKNEITIEGNCEVKLEWREIRKVGEY